jgi:glycoprotein-N-acetylgalactosamine 3-beta-galactosyltransferase
MFDDLPVWIVDAYEDVTDKAVEEKAIEMASKSDTYKWDKLFADWWKEEIHCGLCKLPDSSDEEGSISTSFDPLPAPDYEPNKVVEQTPVEVGKHYRIPPPEDRIGPDGDSGYIHDPAFMRKNPRDFQIIDPDILCSPPGQGIEELEGYYSLERIRQYRTGRGHTGRRDENQDESESDEEERPKTKLMCAVYTYEGGINQTNAIWETWGKRCDGFLFASSSSNLTTGHTHMPNTSNEQHTYGGVFQKVRSMMAYLYDNFLDDYDFFHFLGDDVYLLVDNLKDFLASPEVQSFEDQKPGNLMLAGDWVIWGDIASEPNYNYYLGGGSGYTMSRKTLKAFAEGPLQDEKYGDMSTSGEDIKNSELFRNYFNVTGMDTRDEYGAHRYHQVNAYDAATWPDDAGGFRYRIYRESHEAMEYRRAFPIVYKEDMVSSSSIAFHLVPHELMRRYEMILYGTGVEQCGENMTIIL